MSEAATLTSVASESLYEGEWLTESKVEDGIIKNVLLCGNRSRNGREIPTTAFGSEDRVRRLYENKHIYLDHPPSTDPADLQRSLCSLGGYITNVRLEGGKPRGDIITKGAPKGGLLLQLAEAKMPKVGLSHVAKYLFTDHTRATVESVEEVFSVDAVCDPATASSFFEHVQCSSSEGNTAMPDAVVEKLSDQLESLREQLSEMKVENTNLKDQLKASKDSATQFETRVAELKVELEAEQAKVQKFEAESVQRQRQEDVKSELSAAGLDVSDKDKVSDLFVESLCAVEEPEKRKLMIEDRVALVGVSQEGDSNTETESTKPKAKPRKSPKDSEKEWDVEYAIKNVKFC